MSEPPVEITRYPNRRLYDKSRGQYVTLQDIEDLVRAGRTVVVTDSKSGDDLTRTILAQIILERHPERMDLLPVSFLHLMLRANDMALDWMRTYLRQAFSYLEGLPFPAVAPPLAVPLDWMRLVMPGFGGPTAGATQSSSSNPLASNPASGGSTPESSASKDSAPSDPAPVGADALAARIEELERRLRELEATNSS